MLNPFFSVNRPDTCARSLCECDLEMVRQIIANAGQADSAYQTYNGFDQSAVCGSITDLGRSSLSNPFGSSKKSKSDEVQCCGVYPNRYPLNGKIRKIQNFDMFIIANFFLILQMCGILVI